MRAQQIGQHDQLPLPGQRDEVLGADVPEDVIERAGVDGDAGAEALEHEVTHPFGRRVDGDGVDLVAGDHRVAQRQLVEAQRARRQLTGVLVNVARLGGLADHLLQLRRRDPRLDEVRLVAERPQQKVRAGGQQPDEGAHRPRHRPERLRGQQGIALGRPQAQRLRDQLAQHERQVREGRDHQPERDVVGVPPDAQADDQRLEVNREGGAAEGRGGRGDDGDANLDGGQQPLGLGPQRRDGAGPNPVLGDQLGDAGGAQRHQRHLGPGKKAVGRDQRQQ